MEKFKKLRAVQLFLMLAMAGTLSAQEVMQSLPEADCPECVGDVFLPYSVRELGPDPRYSKPEKTAMGPIYYEWYDRENGFRGGGIILSPDHTFEIVPYCGGGWKTTGEWKEKGNLVTLHPALLDSANMVSNVRSRCMIDRSYVKYIIVDKNGRFISSLSMHKEDKNQQPQQWFPEDTIVGYNLDFMVMENLFNLDFKSEEPGATEFTIQLKYSKYELETYSEPTFDFRFIKAGDNLYHFPGYEECDGNVNPCIDDWLKIQPRLTY